MHIFSTFNDFFPLIFNLGILDFFLQYLQKLVIIFFKFQKGF